MKAIKGLNKVLHVEYIRQLRGDYTIYKFCRQTRNFFQGRNEFLIWVKWKEMK